MKCPTCNGVGKFPSPADICSVCSGSGNLSDDLIDKPACTVCKGSGKYPSYSSICNNCNGYGKQPSLEKQLTAIYVEPGKYKTTHSQLMEVFKDLSGDLCICDPYYGQGTLVRLSALVHCDSIHFLTKWPAEKEKSFIDQAVSEFQRQFKHFKFRKCNARVPLHDRYILTSDCLILLGHGLTHIGSKESFVVQLSKNIVGDVIESVRESFESRWEKATPLV